MFHHFTIVVLLVKDCNLLGMLSGNNIPYSGQEIRHLRHLRISEACRYHLIFRPIHALIHEIYQCEGAQTTFHTLSSQTNYIVLQKLQSNDSVNKLYSY